VTSLDLRGGGKPRIVAFDTGPANILMDMAVRHFSDGRQVCDKDGLQAARGRVNEMILAGWLKHPYFNMRPPKSTGRELFGEQFLEKAISAIPKRDDLLATLAELTARSIAESYQKHLPNIPDEVILCGGGAYNAHLRARIASAVHELRPGTRVGTSAEFRWDPQVIEPCAFALLAWLSFHGKAGNLPQTTGASGPRVLGQVTFPRLARRFKTGT
jgi:anhydro-N-acetylmuramic acid kinase